MPKGEKDDSGAESEKKNSWKLIKLLWICFFFWMTDFLSGNFSLFSQVSAKKIQNFTTFLYAFVQPEFLFLSFQNPVLQESQHR